MVELLVLLVLLLLLLAMVHQIKVCSLQRVLPHVSDKALRVIITCALRFASGVSLKPPY
jgi:hypothetical protein